MSVIPVQLSIQGKQFYDGQEPDVIELVTDGTLEQQGKAWVIGYDETELTGMAGVHTEFRIGPKGISLVRNGKLDSRMIFREGKRHESLYRMDFGALMIAVEGKKIQAELTQDGGTVDLSYLIEIEQSAQGVVEYHLDVRPQVK